MPRGKRKINRKRKRKRKAMIPRLLGNSQITRMRYVKGFTLNPGIGAVISRVFRANGITVCDTTGATGQPTGFDQFNAFFTKYRILEAKIKMTYVPTNLTNVQPGVYGVFVDNDASLGYADYQGLLMGNQSKTKDVKLAGILGGVGLTLMPTTASYNAKRVYTKIPANDIDQFGDKLANPLQSQYFQCWYGSPDILNDPGPSHFLVQIDYVVQWLDKELTIGSQV